MSTETTAYRVREVRHVVHVDLPDDFPPVTTAFSKRRRPAALILEYGIRRDVSRVDITVQWRNGHREHFGPDQDMPEPMRRIVDANRPVDVDDPDAGRRTGMGGWTLEPAQPVDPAVVDAGEACKTQACRAALDNAGLEKARYRVGEQVRAALEELDDLIEDGRLSADAADTLRSMLLDVPRLSIPTP